GGAIPPGSNLVPHSPLTAANVGASAPALVAHAQAPNGVPDNLLVAAPGYDARAGSHFLGVPQVPAAQQPALALPAAGGVAPLPSTYYFLADPSTNRLPGGSDFVLPAGEELTALPFALPGVTAPRIPAEARTPASEPVPGPTFYFVDPLSGQRDEVPQIPEAGHPPFDVLAVRRDFPILQERVNGRPLVWFDNAATTQKPKSVIDRLAHFYAHENSNVHRAAHELAARSTDAYENAREIVRRFLGAGSVEEIVFVRGTTEAINLVAKSWGIKHIGAGDEIVLSHLEHHANIVPWQQLASEKGAKIRVIPVDDSGQVILGEYQRLLNDKTKIVAIAQVSNALGTVVPVKQIVEIAHRAGVRTLVDGAQSVAHMRVDMRELDADFFAFSGHKIFGPTGIGVLYGKREVLEDMPPWQGGGNMIKDVTFERTVYDEPPTRFEAGTGNIADAVGLGAALEYVERLGIENLARYEHALLEYATSRMLPIPGLDLIGTAADKASVLSFVLDGHTVEQVGAALNEEGIAVRAGHHCAQPILRRFGVEATVRASLAFYNTCEEVDRFVAALYRLAAAVPPRQSAGPRSMR
ncbi:MAG TPA: family 2A encapsulin nanocompartment cargo protein cysteine desulfurase, partial [Burkholderiaceae bacterium]|nr:family 2A encapsulin nanocompartment cargo protein cysteine desulfurase [Burkholderiaceae bacterium]